MTNTTVPRCAVMMNNKYPGIALPGYFASSAWLESEEMFNDITGRSFGWYCLTDQKNYRDDKGNFRLMTETEYQQHKSKIDIYFKQIKP